MLNSDFPHLQTSNATSFVTGYLSNTMYLTLYVFSRFIDLYESIDQWCVHIAINLALHLTHVVYVQLKSSEKNDQKDMNVHVCEW